MLDAQHFNSLADNPVNQNVVWVRHQLARPFNTANPPLHWVLVEQTRHLDQGITQFDGRPRVVLGDVISNALAVGTRGRSPYRQGQCPMLSARLTSATRSAAHSAATSLCGRLGRGSSIASWTC